MDGRWDKYAWTYDAFGAKNSTLFGTGMDTVTSRQVCMFTHRVRLYVQTTMPTSSDAPQ